MRFGRGKAKPVPDNLDRCTRNAVVLFETGQYERAERLWRPLLADHERILGPDHQETIRTRDRLASVLFRLRRPGEAAEMHREAHRRAIGTFGRNHPETLFFAHNLGAALVVANRREGIQILEDTMTRQRRKIGRSHKDTLTTAKTLGCALFTAGDVQHALQILGSAFETSSRAFGDNDPLVQDIAHQLDVVSRNSIMW